MFDQCTDTIIRQVDDIKRMVDEFSSFARTLFGVESGVEGQARVGALEEAHGGTLYLDEIADMPRETQAVDPPRSA